MGRGIAFPSVSRDQIVRLPIPLPPLAEQHRIAEKVDELMTLCDRLEAARAEREKRRDTLVSAANYHVANAHDPESARAHIRFYVNQISQITYGASHIQQLRQTILDVGVNGKLSRQTSDDEPASELLSRCFREKEQLLKDGTMKRIQPFNPILAQEMLFDLPSGWEWVRLSDLLLGDSQNGYSKKPDDALDGIPILRISAGTARADGVVAEEEHKYIGGITAAQRNQYRLLPGDLLACRFNGNRSFVGRLSLYLGYLGIDPIYPDKLIRLRLMPGLMLPKLVQYFAQSSAVRKDIESYCATTVGNWGISASNLKEVKIPLPPMAEQRRIVERLELLMGLCDELQIRLDGDAEISRDLLEAVLNHAMENPTVGFCGEKSTNLCPVEGKLHERTI